MDGAKIHVAVSSLLECSICLQVFQDPRNLPCGHTFCLQCIQKTKSRLCSLCKREWTLLENGWQGLPKNFVAENCITSLPSMSYCAVVGNSSHGAVKFLCIDCWDPMCENCGQGHTQFSRTTKNHVVKIISEVDQSDIEVHNKQKALLCNLHKNEPIKFYCTNCEKFGCNTCYILFHNKHDCMSIEEADAKACAQIDDLVKKVQESVDLKKQKTKEIKLSKETLENDKHELLESVKRLINDVKGKLQIEHEKILAKIDEYYKNLLKLIVEKINKREVDLESNMRETQATLQSLQEMMTSYKRQSSPLSNAIERASFLRDSSITQLSTMLQVNSCCPDYQLPDISQWKHDIDDWVQSVIKLLNTVKDLPQIDDNTSRNTLVKSKLGFVNGYVICLNYNFNLI